MPCFGRTDLASRLGLALLMILLLAGRLPRSRAADAPADGYTPVAGARAVHAALLANLKIAQLWLNDKDYASAGESADGLKALAHLYLCQSAQPEWKKHGEELRLACNQFADGAKAKDAARCKEAVQRCLKLLEAAGPLPDTKSADRGFKPQGGTKTWMLLVEGAYTDAKSVKSAADLELHASMLAEQVNVLQHLRGDPKWRQSAQSVRDAALQVAATARKNDFDTARKELKIVYNRCEACHQGYKK